MRNLLFTALFIAAAFSLGSCHTVYYAEPQPVGKRALSSFPKPVRGKLFLTADHSTFVEVTQNTLNLGDDSELLILGENLVLKRFARHYIISLQTSESKGWDVYAVRRQKDHYSVKSLRLKEENLYKINEVLGRDAVKYDSDGDALPLNISKREFRKLLKELFVEVDVN